MYSPEPNSNDSSVVPLYRVGYVRRLSSWGYGERVPLGSAQYKDQRVVALIGQGVIRQGLGQLILSEDGCHILMTPGRPYRLITTTIDA